MAVTGKPSPFRIEGGRSGTILYDAGDRAAELGWEMAAGGVEMVIYESECRWTSPTDRKMDPDEIVVLVRQLASALPGRIEISFKVGAQVIDPE